MRLRASSVFVSCSLLAVLLFAATTAAQVELFRDQMNDGTDWGVNSTSSDVLVTFNYNYNSVDGIPEAPHSQGGDVATRGVKMEANLTSGALTALTVYPLNENFTGSHTLRFDAWMNYDLEEVLGAAVGTTEFLGGGVGYDNVTADVAAGAQAIATGEGGSGNDWRAFKSPPQFFIDAAAMSGGTRQGSDAYYSDFLPGVKPPAAQFQPDLPGITGSPGFQWITWEFAVDNTGGNKLVTVTIEKPDLTRLPIVEIDCNDTSDGSSGCATEGNISLFYADFFPSLTTRPDLTFGVIDNVEVTGPEVVSLPGDFNGDGWVDAADYTVWRDNLGTDFDLNGNGNEMDGSAGVVDGDDYTLWVDSFGTHSEGGSSLSASAVPEPASAGLVCGLALCGLVAVRGRRRRDA